MIGAAKQNKTEILVNHTRRFDKKYSYLKNLFADGFFDAIVSMETIEHLEQYQDYLAECKRVLKEGGLFICSTPLKYHDIPEPAKPNPYHAHEFYLEEFQELLSHFFAEVQLYGQGYWSRYDQRDVR